jgi:redox-sensitive bicupin YhaK (pirin superfamily)
MIELEVNWMIAGRGVTHSERFERARREGGRMHGVQAWVALPREHEEIEPAFEHHGSEALPAFESAGLCARLVAGEAFGTASPVQTCSPLFYVHWTLAAGARAELEARYPERAAYVASGVVEIAGQSFREGQMHVFAPGLPVLITAVQPAVIMLLGGEPIGERFIDWNFVSSSKERISQAKADWRAGRMKLPHNDDVELIPLPPDPGVPANPMS